MLMKQQDLGLNLNKRRTRKAVFLDEIGFAAQSWQPGVIILPHD
jgi:hypothetical protein